MFPAQKKEFSFTHEKLIKNQRGKEQVGDD